MLTQYVNNNKVYFFYKYKKHLTTELVTEAYGLL